MADEEVRCPFGNGGSQCPAMIRIDAELRAQKDNTSVISQNLDNINGTVSQLVAKMDDIHERYDAIEKRLEYVIVVGAAIFGEQILKIILGLQ